MLVLRVEGGGDGGLEDIEAEAVQSETRACRCRLDAVVPGFLLPTPQGGLWGYGPGNGGKAEAWGKRESNPLYFRLCLVCNINLEPESEQTKKGTTGTRRYVQLHSS
ncbi:hypothetical protein NEUTE2DRAFT_123659 [Neurospora tetrasperma FGSC 2509]|nr:hypothetical protein NEUTE2DRAFT_123659 [Neurospora tetrasperma FGSC 2509]